MAKWADYCVSKISFDEKGKNIIEAVVHIDRGDAIGSGEIYDRNWLVQQAKNKKTLCCIKLTNDGKWTNICAFEYHDGSFKWNAKLPEVLTKRKTFVSYYHKADQEYKTKFENLYNDLIVSKSVQKDDIDSDNSDQYIKQLIQKGYLSDTTVLVVLIGSKTKCRMHVDWEISGALNLKVGEKYSGLLGLILPGHPDYGTEKATYDLMPARLADNFKSGYAVIRDWTEDRVKMQSYIEEAFANRSSKENERTNSRVQMTQNSCE